MTYDFFEKKSRLTRKKKSKDLYVFLIESLIILFQPNDEEESVKSSNSRSKLGSRLSVRNGRSVVHKNLEDNYGAVISANHEALAQILEQVKKKQ